MCETESYVNTSKGSRDAMARKAGRQGRKMEIGCGAAAPLASDEGGPSFRMVAVALPPAHPMRGLDGVSATSGD